jgi:hypothetical protein
MMSDHTTFREDSPKMPHLSTIIGKPSGPDKEIKTLPPIFIEPETTQKDKATESLVSETEPLSSFPSLMSSSSPSPGLTSPSSDVSSFTLESTVQHFLNRYVKKTLSAPKRFLPPLRSSILRETCPHLDHSLGSKISSPTTCLLVTSSKTTVKMQTPFPLFDFFPPSTPQSMMDEIYRQLPPWLRSPSEMTRLVKNEIIYPPAPQRAIIFLDGHSSRMNPRLWNKCRQAGIDVFCVPSHATHLIQPLDKYPNAQFKRILGSHKLQKQSSQDISSFATYIHSVKDSICQALNPRLIQGSFRDTGLCPFNPSCVLAGLPLHCPEQFQPRRKSTRYTINDKELTDESVLTEMKKHSREDEWSELEREDESELVSDHDEMGTSKIVDKERQEQSKVIFPMSSASQTEILDKMTAEILESESDS